MYISGKIMLKSKDVVTFIEVIVADVFSENNELKVIISGQVQEGSEILSNIKEYDSIVMPTFILDYGLLIISKDFLLDIDRKLGVDEKFIRMYVGIEDLSSTVLTAYDRTLTDAEPIDKNEIELLINDYTK